MALLRVESLTKRFGGLTAVADLNFEIQEGEIVGLIGPNGAGKTTVFNLISGLISSDRGHIHLAGENITPLKPYLKTRKGIGRTFQIVRPFENMTVLGNVMVSTLVRHPHAREAEQVAFRMLELLGLTSLALAKPQNLTLARRKRLEVARALATQPKLLLLDEVLAGLNPVEVEESLPLIRKIRESGVTVFIIEHIMAALMSVSDRVLVMDQGQLIASGTPAEVTGNRRVIEAYLGEEVARA
jgi:branched-chain amino acid transport system ATP-binding protein